MYVSINGCFRLFYRTTIKYGQITIPTTSQHLLTLDENNDRRETRVPPPPFSFQPDEQNKNPTDRTDFSMPRFLASRLVGWLVPPFFSLLIVVIIITVLDGRPIPRYVCDLTVKVPIKGRVCRDICRDQPTTLTIKVAEVVCSKVRLSTRRIQGTYLTLAKQGYCTSTGSVGQADDDDDDDDDLYRVWGAVCGVQIEYP